MGNRRTPRQRLASLLIGRDVNDVIAEMRANGDTWPVVAQHIKDATDGEIDVTWQAVQQWHGWAQQDNGAA
ncbi:MAG: hypothetical protein ACXV5Q_01460 [Frankiaceae bacterium]